MVLQDNFESDETQFYIANYNYLSTHGSGWGGTEEN